MQPEPQPPAVRITDADRERAVEILQQACGDGRLTLEEFSVRAGAVWAADDSAELARTTADVAPQPTVGSSQRVEQVVNVFSSSKRRGRWQMPRRIRVVNVFGDTQLDLREAALGPEVLAAQVVEIAGWNVFGSIKVIVPEGVDVDLAGWAVFGSREARLAPVQRLAGTPTIVVNIHCTFGDVKVESRGPNSPAPLLRRVRDAFGR
jgi:hypothetical protein